MDWLSEDEVSAVKQFPSGAWEVSAIIGGYRKARTYYGYTKREAIRAFIREMTK